MAGGRSNHYWNGMGGFGLKTATDAMPYGSTTIRTNEVLTMVIHWFK